MMAQKKRGLVMLQDGKEEPKESKRLTLGEMIRQKIENGQVKVQHPPIQFNIFGRPY